MLSPVPSGTSCVRACAWCRLCGVPAFDARYFRCLLDSNFPYISFCRPGFGSGFPWITLARVFVAQELRSLRRVDASHIVTGIV